MCDKLEQILNYCTDDNLIKEDLRLLSIEVSNYTSLCHYLLSSHKLVRKYQYQKEVRPRPLYGKFQKVLKSFQIGLNYH